MKRFDEKRFDAYAKMKLENYEENRAHSLFPQFYPPKNVLRRMLQSTKIHAMTWQLEKDKVEGGK